MNSDISGPWNAVLDTGAIKAVLSFRLEPHADGIRAWLRTREGEVALPVREAGGRMEFESRQHGIAFAVTADQSAARLAGTCRYSSVSFPIIFTRGEPTRPPRTPRPQTPEPPFPYEASEVSFAAADGSLLAATLTRPTSEPSRGAIVLSTWFGRVDRNQTMAGHQPFAIWADEFTRRGFATLRYDKRGAGASAGDFSKATTGDFAGDVACAAAFLRALPDIDPRRTGLFGHSEGGHISADAAAADPSIAFCILLTPTGVAEEETFETELFRAAKAVGGTAIEPEKAIRLTTELAHAARAAKSAEGAVAATRALLKEHASDRYTEEQIEARAAMEALPWRRYWRRYDHTASLRALSCPTFVVFAGRDLQTPPHYNAPPVRAALKHNPNPTIVELADLNHFLQRARTGAPSEYADIDETLAPEAINAVCDWLSHLF